MTPLFETMVSGRRVRSARPLGSYLAELAAAVSDRLGRRPGSIFFADLLRYAKDTGEIFPETLGGLGRRMRLERLGDSPMEVDGLLLSVTADKRDQMYQKTRRVVAVLGSLGDGPSTIETKAAPVAFTPGNGPSMLERVSALETWRASAGAPPPFSADAAALGALDARFKAFEIAMADFEHRVSLHDPAEPDDRLLRRVMAAEMAANRAHAKIEALADAAGLREQLVAAGVLAGPVTLEDL